MQSEVASVHGLRQAISELCIRPSVVVGIEGHSAAGKTTLAKALANAAAGPFFSTDNYARQRGPGENYPDLVDTRRLRRDIAVASQAPLVVVEGICLRDVLDAAGLRADAFVYVKRITPAGLWADDPANHVTDGQPNSDLSWADLESVLYHLRRSPVEHADVVYLHRES